MLFQKTNEVDRVIYVIPVQDGVTCESTITVLKLSNGMVDVRAVLCASLSPILASGSDWTELCTNLETGNVVESVIV